MKRLQYFLLRRLTGLDWLLRRRLTPAGRLMAGTAFAAAIAGVDTHQTLTYQAFTFLAATLLVSAVLALALRFARREFVVGLRLSGHALGPVQA